MTGCEELAANCVICGCAIAGRCGVPNLCCHCREVTSGKAPVDNGWDIPPNPDDMMNNDWPIGGK